MNVNGVVKKLTSCAVIEIENVRNKKQNGVNFIDSLRFWLLHLLSPVLSEKKGYSYPYVPETKGVSADSDKAFSAEHL